MPNDPELVTVGSYTRLEEANGARAVLEAAGLSPILRDEMTGSIDWGLMPAIGGIRLEVPAEEEERAREVLGTYETVEPPTDPEEIAAIEEARRKKRWIGIVALVLMFLPAILFVIFRILY